MGYGGFRAGRQHRLVRTVDELARRQLASLFQYRYVVSDARAFRRVTEALVEDRIAQESRAAAASLISYVDAVLPVRYSPGAESRRLALRVGATRLDVSASIVIPTHAHSVINEINGPYGMRTLVELLHHIDHFFGLIDELERRADRFLDARMKDDRRQEPRAAGSWAKNSFNTA